ncbi:MAG: methylated-DNA--[protein]-cysteine S-methyltransferase, partial [Tatlockia sp.]|nr:methylated-DNA--[protein]-cysteine S-methyltransferase [Tatlockia sp.]
TISYGEQAKSIGDKNKARAVGAANGRNPISIVIPCHRVIGSKGHLVGFGGGIEKKAYLLNLEKNQSC